MALVARPCSCAAMISGLCDTSYFFSLTVVHSMEECTTLIGFLLPHLAVHPLGPFSWILGCLMFHPGSWSWCSQVLGLPFFHLACCLRVQDLGWSPPCMARSFLASISVASISSKGGHHKECSQAEIPTRMTSAQMSFSEMVSDSLGRNYLVIQTDFRSSCPAEGQLISDCLGGEDVQVLG